MKQIIIEPRDSLLFRDAKEFGSEAGSATSLPFPLPSVLAGAIRSRYGWSQKLNFDDPSARKRLLSLSVHSPLLVELGPNDELLEYYLPAPMDAVVFTDDKQSLYLKRLLPHRLSDEILLDTLTEEQLLPLSFQDMERRKPAPFPPKFWPYSQLYVRWLQEPASQLPVEGMGGPVTETRIHVKLGSTQTAEEGKLFSTTMLRFRLSVSSSNTPPTHPVPLSSIQRFALAAFVDDELNIQGIFPLGGERRLAHWTITENAFPPCPTQIKEEVVRSRRARIILITPAYFGESAWRPESFGSGIALKAVAIRRYTVGSGWDLALKQPKPSRRLAPAGTVYFIEFDQTWHESDLATWVEEHWLKSISSEEQARLDGFGLCLVGTWSDDIPLLTESLIT